MSTVSIERLMGMSPSELDDALADAELARRRVEAELAAVVAVIDSRQTYRDHGHLSIRGLLKQALNCSGAEANRLRRLATLVDHHPDIGERLEEGRIGVGQADRLAKAATHRRVGDRFGEFAPILSDHAERLEYRDFDIAVSHFETMADADGAFDDHRFQTDQRTATVSINRGGGIDLTATGGDALSAAEMKAIFDAAVEAEFRADCERRRADHPDDPLAHGLPRSSHQRRFDALHAIFTASVTAPADGKRPEPLVNLIIDPTTALEALARHGLIDLDDGDTAHDAEPLDPATRRCATSTGTPVHPDVVVRAMLLGQIRRVVVDAHDVVINLGRRQRLFTGHARQAARLLVTTCGHRGCDIPAHFCDIDHVDEWAEHGGTTDQHNSGPLCGTHDRWKHRRGLRGRRDRHGRIHLIRPDGTVIKPVGARDPEWADPDSPELNSPEPGWRWRQLDRRELDRRCPRFAQLAPEATVRILEPG